MLAPDLYRGHTRRVVQLCVSSSYFQGFLKPFLLLDAVLCDLLQGIYRSP